MRKFFLPILGLLLTLLTGCWQSVIFDEKITGPYRLSAIDISEQMSVCYELKGKDSCVGRIEETVFSVGWSEQFIVAKQHPSNDRSVTNYFIIDIQKDAELLDPSESVTGPLTEAEYQEKSKSMSLPAFSRTLEDLR
ncbi:DUF3997 domain-containing protein [Duganella sp. Root1480D1]|uniref:DUF3997 domain-containing protein n=1 Tax=Duganella sp. Root1480D1 TaxID=1736471 RepID=UPI00070C06CE|nr:DUF3997 domain-containing protein [Duganella sp. Root1480D1]KQZ34145.1 hypothetical protein ASD58_29095 [Duganella sp. Root1480D1]